MRRKTDGWVNATHILKVANFDKPQRTRILEKEVQKGTHEKVQGGYGRYQGTWVPVEVARQIAGQYNVLNDLGYLFDYVESPDNPPPLVKNVSSAARAKAKMLAVSTGSNNATGRASRNQHSIPSTPLSATSINSINEVPGNSPSVSKSSRKTKSQTTTTRRAAPTYSTQQQQQQEQFPNGDSSLKRGRGRPKGVPNKSKKLINNPELTYDPLTIGRPRKQQRTGSSPPPPTARQLAMANTRSSVGSSLYGSSRGFEIDSGSLSEGSSSMSDDDLVSDIDDSTHSVGIHGGAVNGGSGSNINTPSGLSRSARGLDNQSVGQTSFTRHGYKGTQEITDTPSFSSISKKRRNSSVDSIEKVISASGTSSFLPSVDQAPGDGNDQFTSANSNRSVNGLIYGDENLASKYSNHILDGLINGIKEGDDFNDESLLPPPGLDINHVIDEDGHTVFHWACSLGAPRIVDILLRAGADIRAPNLLGQTPLMRSIMYKNNFDLRTFSKIAEVLRDTITAKDINGKTALHHIANSTSHKNLRSAARYYNEILLAKFAEISSRSEIQNFVNTQDNHGDTALHIAAKFGSTKIVKELLCYAADDLLHNADGLTPKNYLNKYEAEKRQRELVSKSYSSSRHNSLHGGAYETSDQGRSSGLGINLASSTPNRSLYGQGYINQQQYTTPNVHNDDIPIGLNGPSLNGARSNQSHIRNMPDSRPQPSIHNGILSQVNSPIAPGLVTTPGGSILGTGIISSSTPTSSGPKSFPPFGIFQAGVAEAKASGNGSASNDVSVDSHSRTSFGGIGSRTQSLNLQTSSAMLEESSRGHVSVGKLTTKLDANSAEVDDKSSSGDNKNDDVIKLTDKSTFSYLPSAQSVVVSRASELAAHLGQVAKISAQEIEEVDEYLAQASKRLADVEHEHEIQLQTVAEKLKELDMEFEKTKWEQEAWKSSHGSTKGGPQNDNNSASFINEMDCPGPYSGAVTSNLEVLEPITEDRVSKLHKILERSQARDVAQYVQHEETLMEDSIRQELSFESVISIQAGNNDGNYYGLPENNIDSETLDLLLQLHTLQHRRQADVNSIVDLWSEAIPDDKKSMAFRRLIAKACSVPEYQIDKDLLNSIIKLLLSGDVEEDSQIIIAENVKDLKMG